MLKKPATHCCMAGHYLEVVISILNQASGTITTKLQLPPTRCYGCKTTLPGGSERPSLQRPQSFWHHHSPFQGVRVSAAEQKHSRPRLAAQRYGAFNKLLGYMSRISSASETIHNDNPEKRKLFLVTRV